MIKSQFIIILMINLIKLILWQITNQLPNAYELMKEID